MVLKFCVKYQDANLSAQSDPCHVSWSGAGKRRGGDPGGGRHGEGRNQGDQGEGGGRGGHPEGKGGDEECEGGGHGQQGRPLC